MGTNYYHYTNECEHCHRANIKHIGKSSMGWTFSFHATDDICSWKDWQKALQKGKIVDEYDREVPLETFIKLVEDKQKILGALNHANQHYSVQDFVDNEGYSFSEGDFS